MKKDDFPPAIMDSTSGDRPSGTGSRLRVGACAPHTRGISSISSPHLLKNKRGYRSRVRAEGTFYGCLYHLFPSLKKETAHDDRDDF